MFKVIMYDDEEKVMEVQTNDNVMIHDVVLAVLNCINFFKDKTNARYE